ncbi:MAG: class I SAM-dependent methyltransferase [Bacilli bacterium]|jgi:protein-L-isoaspartate O-methyltransferase|nr:class I SAM-dependent methyltransferase [Bacilli bacterium]
MKSNLDIVPFSHHLIELYQDLEGIALDMTLGHGYDSIELTKHFKKVFAFDIQEEAINSAKENLKDYHNINIIKDNHLNYDNYVKDKIALAIYNLGYLPHGSKEITTNKDSTIASLRKLLVQLKINGIIILVIYIGHPQGYQESKAINEFIKELALCQFKIIEYKILNRELAPYILIIEKIKE